MATPDTGSEFKRALRDLTSEASFREGLAALLRLGPADLARLDEAASTGFESVDVIKVLGSSAPASAHFAAAVSEYLYVRRRQLRLSANDAVTALIELAVDELDMPCPSSEASSALAKLLDDRPPADYVRVQDTTLPVLVDASFTLDMRVVGRQYEDGVRLVPVVIARLDLDESPAIVFQIPDRALSSLRESLEELLEHGRKAAAALGQWILPNELWFGDETQNE